MWRLIWGNDHLYCGFGARRSHLTLHWMSAQGSVGFRWGTIMGPYHANFSQVETQKFDPHWFYFLQWGCNNLFCQECKCYCRFTTDIHNCKSQQSPCWNGGKIQQMSFDWGRFHDGYFSEYLLYCEIGLRWVSSLMLILLWFRQWVCAVRHQLLPESIQFYATTWRHCATKS